MCRGGIVNISVEGWWGWTGGLEEEEEKRRLMDVVKEDMKLVGWEKTMQSIELDGGRWFAVATPERNSWKKEKVDLCSSSMVMYCAQWPKEWDCEYKHLKLVLFEKFSHLGETQSRVAAGPHWEKPTEVVCAPGQDPDWTSSAGGFPGRSNQDKTMRQTEVPLERLHLLAGRAGQGGCGEGGLGLSA